MDDIRYIDNADALAELAEQLRGERWLAIDTEFERDKTYYPKFCLLQIASDDVIACIDPLALDGLDPLLETLFDPGVTKVLHAARQDLEIFFHLQGAVPKPVFDTQLAAPLLGLPEQMGYGALVDHFLGVKLHKAHARADWVGRPLPPEQIRYAADDVRYLRRIYPVMRERLLQLDRLAWLNDEFDALTEVGVYQPDPNEAWLRAKGVDRLKGKSLSAAQALARWREETAQREDRPRNWLLRDDVLINLALMRPRDPGAIARVRGLSERFIDRHGARLLQVIADAAKHEPAAVDKRHAAKRLSPQQEALVDVMYALVRLQGDKHSLNPSVLASRKELERLVGGDNDVSLLQGWRRELIGNEIEALIAGKLALLVEHGKLEVSRSGEHEGRG